MGAMQPSPSSEIACREDQANGHMPPRVNYCLGKFPGGAGGEGRGWGKGN